MSEQEETKEDFAARRIRERDAAQRMTELALDELYQGPHNAELKRRARWHATFNAALTGLYANPHIDVVAMSWSEKRSMAAYGADQTHGPLVHSGDQR